MKHLMFGLMAAALAGAAGAQPAPASGPAPIRETPSNAALGVSADRYIGDPSRSVTWISRDAILTRAILTPGDPSKPGPGGAALRFRKEVDLGIIQPGESTPLATVPEQQLVYVSKGEGRLDDGAQAWDLKPGSVFIVPPGARHRLASTGPDPLQMIMLSTPAALATAVNQIVVRDVSKVLYTEQNVHWSNHSKAPFSDFGERFLVVYMGPMTVAAYHSHPPEFEEGWVKITDGATLMQLGSEIRRWPANVGILSPNNSAVIHNAINPTESVQAWFYFQGRPAGAPAGPPANAAPPAPPPIIPGGPAANGRRYNTPEIAASAAASTVPSHPLPGASSAPRRR